MLVCETILELARWAPSGDNDQPWKFEIKGEFEVVVHGRDTRKQCVYDRDGRPSQLALGALLETMRIAASAHGLRTDIARRLDPSHGLASENHNYTFDVRFVPDPGIEKSPWFAFIKTRKVQRRPMSVSALTAQQKAALEASVGPGHRVVWFETFAERWRVATLLFRNAKVRLTMPEAFEVHRRVIEWGARESEDRIPGQAVGVDPFSAKLMQWAMQSWSRVEFCNKWLAGTVMPRLQLDLFPGLACAAHVAVVANATPSSIDSYVDSGQALQRFWLEVTRLGLWLQPEMTPVIFGRYVREQTVYTNNPVVRALGAVVTSEFTALWGEERAPRVVFFARLGNGREPVARSTRRPLNQLIV